MIFYSMIQKKIARICLPTLLLLTAYLQLSCGWQLRGGSEAQNSSSLTGSGFSAVHSVHIAHSTKLTQLAQLLKKKLITRGILIDNKAQTHIQLLNERIDKRPMAYGNTGIAIQYQMTLQIDYLIKEASANGVSPQKEANKLLISRRNFDFDPELVSAKDNEENDLLLEMRKEIVNKIIIELRKKQ